MNRCTAMRTSSALVGPLALFGAIAIVHADATMPRSMVPHDTSDRIVWSCQVESLGKPAVMVNYAERTALSTLGGAIATAVVKGEVATWQENDADGVGYRFALDGSKRELRVTLLSGRQKGVVRRGTCAPPAHKSRR